MKQRKLLTALVAITMGTAMCVSISACSHTHEYGEWHVTTAPTCEADGVESRECGDCDEVETRPVTKLGHSYGDWQITKPTLYARGSAVMPCANDAEHNIVVELPALTAEGTGYDSVTETDGVRTYTLNHANGNISFTTDAPVTVTEAVAASLANSDKVAHGSVAYESKIRGDWEEGQELDEYGHLVTKSNVSYDHGDNYVHIVDGANGVEGWYSLYGEGDEAELFALRQYTGGKLTLDEAATEDILNGYSFRFMYLIVGDEVASVNGLENFVGYLYSLASNDENKDFAESIALSEDKATFQFSFSLLNREYFNMISVSFTLDEAYMANSVNLSVKTYHNNQHTYEETGEDTGVYRLKEGKENDYIISETFTIAQSSLGADETLPANPYKYDELIVESFDVVKVEVPYKDVWEEGKDANGQEGGAWVKELDWDNMQEWEIENDTLELDPTIGVTLMIKNVKPDTANTSVDAVKIYERTADGDVELKATYSAGDDWHIKAVYTDSDMLLTLNSYVAGEHTIVIKTKNVEKVLTLNIPYVAPTNFNGGAYIVDEIKDFGRWVSNTEQFTVYAGQSFNFRAVVGHPAYEDSGFTAEVLTSPEGETEAEFTLTDAEIDGYSAKVFKATTVGTYTIKLTSAANENKTVTLTVTVTEAPDVADIFNGKLANEDEDVSVTFEPDEEGGLSGKVTIVLGTEDRFTTSVFSYSCNAETRAISVTKSNGDTAEFSFELTEQYNLFISYTDDFGEVQRVYIANGVINNLVGAHHIDNADGIVSFTVNQTGMYTLTVSTTSALYRVNGGSISMSSKAGQSYRLRLYEGDTIELWSNYYLGTDFTFEFREFIYVNDIELVDEEGNVQNEVQLDVSQTLTLIANVLPEDADNKTVTWTTSDANIATVDSKGVVTGIAVGQVVIKATTADGGYFAECVVNVILTPVKGISLNYTEAELVYNVDTLQLEATLEPKNASIRDITWTSSNEKVATVDANGLVTPKNGFTADEPDATTATATIKATTKDGEFVAECVITVKIVKATEITLDKTEAAIIAGGETLQLTATIAPENTSNKTITWTSSDTTVATVNANGVVTGVGGGTATITAEIDGQKATCTVNVTYINLESISLPESVWIWNNGSSAQMSATLAVAATPADASNKAVTWKSSDTNTVRVATSGKVTANGVGTATITATSKENTSLKATCQVTVGLLLGDTTKNKTGTISKYILTGGKPYGYYGLPNTVYKITLPDGLYFDSDSTQSTLTATTDEKGFICFMLYTANFSSYSITVELVQYGDAETPYSVAAGTYTAVKGATNYYKLTVAEGETYSVTSDATIVVGASISEGHVVADTNLDLAALTEGTYYFEINAADAEADLTFTVAKVEAVEG